jgi:DNA primase
MQKITRSFIDHLIKSVKIVDFMEKEYNYDFIKSKRSNWVNTNCPLPDHDDSNPSFGVNEESNLYSCFGCGSKGDIIKLVQTIEGLNFIESVQKISNFAGIDIELTNLDIKTQIKEFQDSLNDFYKQDSNFYPGNLSEISFLIAFSERTKRYLRKVNFDNEELMWIENLYFEIEKFSKEENYKKIEQIWNEFSKLSKKRYLNHGQ